MALSTNLLPGKLCLNPGFVHFLKSRADLDFLWMMLDRFGVNPPSLDSVLSFKIDGLEDMLPLNKVVIEICFNSVQVCSVI